MGWDTGTTYNQFNLVYFNGRLYLALNDNSGVAPDSDPSVWQVI